VALSRNSAVHSHGTLALVSFLAVCTSILATFGLGLWFRIPFSSIVLTLAFLLLGLGTDDTFVLVAAFQNPDVCLSHVLLAHICDTA
jgi:predicted RND superfamily exporter protein